ncbi:STAS domain-containing protein [Nonomuraea sp. LP-02]|uniref:STAS domain-containing protein n=1 Tax=Nonomuraea sp. LP-02 TaxID=3097960 RepID=UPI002E332AE1|nr:STAS domain-containing protein [Nonomuraea sp. LP-02]MED7926066.1 STAS domain-containing protein [Nonomuraea sp. LP-02]
MTQVLHPLRAPTRPAATGHDESGVAEHLLHVDPLLRVTCTVRPGPSLVRVVGEIDRGNAAELRRTLEQAGRIDDELVVDVGGVSFTDVTGLRALAAFAASARAVVRDVPHQMSRLMGLVGMPAFGEPVEPPVA